MKYQKEIQKINELVKVCEIVRGRIEDVRGYRSFGMMDANISFIGSDSVNLFQNALLHLYRLKPEVSKVWTLKTFENELVVVIRRLKNDNLDCSESDINNFFQEFDNNDLYESEILYELFGAKMNSDKLSFGDFTVYNFELSIEYLTSKYPYLKQGLYFSNRKSDYLLGIKVSAKENAKAVEIADELCKIFDNVFSYMISDLKHENTVSVFNYRMRQSIDVVVCNEKSMGFQGKGHLKFAVDISDPFFNDSSQGNDKIWKLITQKNKSAIEARILNSIEWIGKAVDDLDNSKSLVQFVFAIEGMLQFNDKTLITPSIVSQLSDWMAFIIQDSSEERKKISKYFKDIYQKRSAIAHGAAKIIDNEDLSVALQLSKLMIVSFLTTEPFNKMKTMEELNSYLTDLKFR